MTLEASSSDPVPTLCAGEEACRRTYIREEQRAYHQTVVEEIRTEIKEQELLMDRLWEQRRELVGLLTSNRVLKGRMLEFELRKPFDALVSAANCENGWGARIRT